jgi:hypothetical protein
MNEAHMLVLIRIETESYDPFWIEEQFYKQNFTESNYVRLIGCTKIKDSDGNLIMEDDTYTQLMMQENIR